MVETILITGEHVIGSVADFLTQLHPHMNEVRLATKVIFRGQAEDKLLRSKLVRYFEFDQNHSENEYPEKLTRLVYSEITLLTEFQRQAPPFLGHDPQNILEWLALAQHHGLATRLLDWAENPLTAMFFAVEDVNLYDSDGVIWVFFGVPLRETPDFQSLLDLDQFLAKVGVTIYFPKHISPRFSAQQGCFTMHSLHQSDFSVGLQERKANWDYTNKLVKFIIPSQQKPNLRRELETLGVNHLTLFPDLDGLSKKLNWEHLGRLQNGSTTNHK